MFALKDIPQTLRQPSKKVESEEEAYVLIKTLESAIGNYKSLSAPEVGVQSSVAIIRLPTLSLNLINPEIISESLPVISHTEECYCFPNLHLNCLRHDYVMVRNGMYGNVSHLYGVSACLVQHQINHLQGIVYHDRVIKLAEVHENNLVRNKDFCPCGSKKRFASCCMIHKSISLQMS